MKILFLFLMALISSFIARASNKTNVSPFQGDPSFKSIGDLSTSVLGGDANAADQILNAIGDLTTANSPHEEVILTGDVDADLDDAEDNDFIGAAKVNDSKTKSIKKTFPSGLLKKSIAKKTIDGAKTGAVDKSKVVALNEMSKVPGALLSKASFPPLSVVGGNIKRTATNLLLDGRNFLFSLQNWMAGYPGLSYVTSNTSTGATITITITALSSPYCTRVMPIIFTFAANDLNKIRMAQVAFTFAAPLSDGSAMSISGDLVEIFSGDATVTKVIFFPYKVIKQRLHALPAVPAANPNELIITLVGVPSGTLVTTSLASDDDSDWVAFQRMMNL